MYKTTRWPKRLRGNYVFRRVGIFELMVTRNPSSKVLTWQVIWAPDPVYGRVTLKRGYTDYGFDDAKALADTALMDIGRPITEEYNLIPAPREPHV